MDLPLCHFKEKHTLCGSSNVISPTKWMEVERFVVSMVLPASCLLMPEVMLTNGIQFATKLTGFHLIFSKSTAAPGEKPGENNTWLFLKFLPTTHYFAHISRDLIR